MLNCKLLVNGRLPVQPCGALCKAAQQATMMRAALRQPWEPPQGTGLTCSRVNGSLQPTQHEMVQGMTKWLPQNVSSLSRPVVDNTACWTPRACRGARPAWPSDANRGSHIRLCLVHLHVQDGANHLRTSRVGWGGMGCALLAGGQGVHESLGAAATNVSVPKAAVLGFRHCWLQAPAPPGRPAGRR